MLIFLVLAFVFAALEWASETRKYKPGIYFTKPAAMICLILWVWTYNDLPSMLANIYTFSLLWFVIGMFFCLIGDIFLMFPPERFFLPGLIAFLLGHLFYIIGFGQVYPDRENLLPGLILMAMVLAVFITVYQKLARGLDASGKARMKVPVFIYAIVISVMLYAALLTLLHDWWQYTPAFWVTAGALLFYVSDILNAWTRFVRPLSNDRFKIMTTYHLGQIALAVGVSFFFAQF